MVKEEEDLDKRLAEEVGSLSTRLVTAVNKQVELEETILYLRKQLSSLQSQNDKLIINDKRLNEILPKYNQLTKDVLELKIKKETAENENSKLQNEVEELTASLFDEANTMVSNASRETHNFKIKNQKLYEELEEKDNIINDLQEQLQDLKSMFIKIEEQSKIYSHSNTTTLKLEQNLEFTTNNDLSTTTTRSEDIQQSQQQQQQLEQQQSQQQQQLEQAYQLQQLQSIIYSPNISSIRFDLNNFNLDFKVFVYELIKPDFQLDLSHLKNLIFFKNIWSNEIENCINHIPSIPSNTLLNRWQKGKTFWSCLIDGKVSIEPIKGTNENFKITYKGKKLNDKITPVAIQDPCTFCGESRNDNLEHSRLYYFKIFETDENLPISYPLCNYCVIKLRNLCDFFAKIRLIKSNIFKLKQNNQFTDYYYNINSPYSQFKRTNSKSKSTISNSISNSNSNSNLNSNINYESHNGEFHNIKLDKIEECKLIKLYIMMVLIRCKIFWSKLGFWDNLDQINEVNLDEIHYETFNYFLPNDDYSNSQINTPRPSIDNKINEEINLNKELQNQTMNKNDDDDNSKQDDDDNKQDDDNKLKENQSNDTNPEVENSKEQQQEQQQEHQQEQQEHQQEHQQEQHEQHQQEEDNAEVTKISITKQDLEDQEDTDDDDEEDEFTDSVGDFEPITKDLNFQELKRSDSKSKKFSNNLNKELDNTLKMLAENMDQD